MSLETLQSKAFAEKSEAYLKAYPENLHAVAGLCMGYAMAASNGETLLRKDWTAEAIVAFLHRETEKIQSFLDMAAREHDREQDEKRRA